MDPAALATMAVSVLAPYLAKAGESLAKEAGTSAWKGAQSLMAMIRKKLDGDTYAAQTLQRLEQQPDSTSRQLALSGVLEEKLKEDQAFSAILQASLEKNQVNMDSIHQQISLSGHTQAGDINVIGKVTGGDVDIHSHS